MNNNIRETRGNKFYLSYGNVLLKISNFFKKYSDKYLTKDNKIIISNPTCKFINPFTLMFNFTVNNKDKYQLVHEGEFTNKYKEWKKITEDLSDITISPITIEEMFLVILDKKIIGI